MLGMNEMGISYNNLDVDIDGLESWTEFFNQRGRDADIFSTTINSSNFKTKVSANIIGNKWLQFSILMPKVLCLLAGKVDSNSARMRLLKIAWEELGEGKAKHIHAETFKSCLELADVDINTCDPSAIKHLEDYAEGKFNSTSEIFGLGLGLEIIAIQNIETLYFGLSHDHIVASNLKESEFFEIHFQNEEGHISHCIESFMKYCPHHDSKREFLLGFENGLTFWKMFWSEVADELNSKNDQSVAWAN